MDIYKPTSPAMERVAMILGFVSVMSCLILYISIPVGAIAIILALQSRGGNFILTGRAKIAIVLGILGIGFTIVIYTSVMTLLLHQYGSFENILRAYAGKTGYSYEEIMNMLGQ